MKHNFLFLILSICVVAFFGCNNNGSRPEGMPRLVPCVVTVLSEGQPLSEVDVAFHSSDSTFRWGSNATTDSNGKAVMATYGQFFGVVEGEYSVTVTKLERETFDNEHPPKQIKVFTLTDVQYTNPQTTPLKITVSGKTTQTFDVGKTGKNVLRLESPM
ncbi:MAG: hypothetical protein LBI18_03630 [Planctomycetaceae bacterium]|jgi:hypothetical protein|nr:hypothetical protein [Planctomycetaceae bacterium]